MLLTPDSRRRRVKCDEAHPVCKRCHVGDRSCEYVVPPAGSYSWEHLLQARTSTSPSPPPTPAHLSPSQIRSLEYFSHAVAPVLSGHLGNDFWTGLVLQLALSQESTMQGIQAINLLFAGFEPSWKTSPAAEEEALKHYNRSLRLVATSKLPDVVVLTASVLFVCIEFLRCNPGAAATHCRHSTLLLARSPRCRDNTALNAVLQHLGIFPHFFSSGSFPSLPAAAQETRLDDMPAAATVMDQLLSRAIRLVRSLDAYRMGPDEVEIPIESWDAQQELLQSLTVWKTAFEALLDRQCVPITTAWKALLLMRFHVAWVWVSIASHKAETSSDAFQERFADIVRLARLAHQEVSSGSKFSFTMGTSPLLHFVMIKCRHLPTRLEALEVLRGMAEIRESLWDTQTMYAIGKCIIEHEHGIVLEDRLLLAVDWEWPSDEARIRDSWVEDEVLEVTTENGKKVFQRRIHLFSCSGGVVTEKVDWISSSTALEID